MSELRVASINNPAAASGGLAISATGAVSGAGLDHIVTETFSAASSVSVDSVFSAEYDNYRVILNLASASLTCQLRVRWSASGTPDTSSNYWIAEHQVSGAGGHTIPVSGTSASSAHIGHYIATSSGPVDVSLNVYRPFSATWTRHDGTGSVGIGGISDFCMIQTGSLHKVTTGYDGFQLLNLESATITGSLSVYGYKS